MSTAEQHRTGTTVTGLFLGGLAIAGAVALVTAPVTPHLAKADTVADAGFRQISVNRVLQGKAGEPFEKRRMNDPRLR